MVRTCLREILSSSVLSIVRIEVLLGRVGLQNFSHLLACSRLNWYLLLKLRI